MPLSRNDLANSLNTGHQCPSGHTGCAQLRVCWRSERWLAATESGQLGLSVRVSSTSPTTHSICWWLQIDVVCLPEIMPVDLPFEAPKPVAEFRNYKDSDRQNVVENHYRLMRSNQSFAFVQKMYEKYNFDKPRARMTVREAFRVLESYVDSSDPDVRCELISSVVLKASHQSQLIA